MLTVRTQVKPSEIHGLGLFAHYAYPIKKGTIIWKFDSRIDAAFTLDDLYNLRPYELEYVLHYCFLSPKSGLWILPGDKAKFMNFPKKGTNPTTRESPNLESQEDNLVAACYVLRNKELTVPRSSDLDFNWKMRGGTVNSYLHNLERHLCRTP